MEKKGLTRGLSKFLSVLVSFAMVFAFLPAVAQADGAPATDEYVKVSSIVAGDQYIITSGSYALTNTSGTLGSTSVTLSGDSNYIVSPLTASASMLWTFNSVSSAYYAQNDSYYLTRSSSSLITSTTAPDSTHGQWVYSSYTLKAGSYYLYYTGSAFGVRTTSATITLYHKVTNGKSVSSITMNTNPTNTQYATDNLDTTGTKINVTYNDGATDTVTAPYLTFSPTTPLTPGSNTITVTYGGKQTTFAVTAVAKVINSIAITTAPTKTIYTDAESFDPTNMVVTATYNDSSTAPVPPSDYTYSPSGTLPIGTASVTITETQYSKTTTQAITVNPQAPTVSPQPANITEYIGDSNSLTTGGTVSDSGTISYQWYSNPNGTTYSGTSLGTGARSASYTPSTTTAGTYYFYCAVTNTKSSKTATANTNIVTVVVYTNPVTPTITPQPTGITEYVGDSGTLTTTGHNTDGGTISYQWFSNPTASGYNGTSMGSAAGAQTATFTPPTTAANTYYYYCVVTNTKNGKGATANTNIVSVVVQANPVTPTIDPQPTGLTEYVGDSNTLTTAGHTTDGGAISYQWYSNPNGTTYSGTSLGSASGAQTATYTPPTTAANTYYYYCTVKNTLNGKAATANTNIVTVVVYTNPVTPTITPQPTGITEYVGDSNTLTTTGHNTDGGTISYQWYSNPTASGYNGTSMGSASGAQTATFTPPTTAANTYYYYCVVTNTKNGKGATANTNIVSVVVQANPVTPTIDPQPTGLTEYVGDSNTLTTAGHTTDGGAISYQWYSNPNGATYNGTSLGSALGAQTATYTPPTTAANTYYYYCTVKNTLNGKAATANTNIVTVVVQANPVQPTINPQPTGITEYVGDSGTLTTTGHNTDGGAISYQWYSNPNGTTYNGTSLGSAAGAQTATFTPAATTANTYYYYCVVTNTKNGKGATANTNIVTVVVQANPVQPTIDPQPTGLTEYVGDSNTLTTAGHSTDGGAISYQWFSNPDGTTCNGTSLGTGSGAQTATYTPPAAAPGTYFFYCAVTNTLNSKPATVNSDIVTVVVIPNPAPIITGEPANIDENIGGNDTMTVTATGNGALTYQWYDNGTTNGNSGGTPIEGADEATYQPASSDSDVGAAYYYCVVTDTVGSRQADAPSRAAKAYIYPDPSTPSITGEPSDISENIGDTLSISVTAAGNGDLTYQWYDNGTTDGNDGGTPIQDANEAAYQPASSEACTTYYYCVVTNTSGSETAPNASQAAQVFIYPDPTTPAIDPATPANIAENINGAGTLSVAAAGNGDLTYQWYNNGTTDGSDGGTPIQGATGTDYQPDSSTDGTTYYYCVVTNTSGALQVTNASQAARVLIYPDPSTPSITGEPSDISENIGDTLSISVTAAGNGDLTYQWYDNGTTDGNDGGTPIQDANEAAYQPASSEACTTYYYCVVTNTSGSETAPNASQAAQVFIYPDPTTPAIDPATPANIAENINGAGTLSVAAAGNGDLTYQWYNNGTTDGSDGGTPIQGATGTDYQPDSSTDGTTYYYCVVTNTSGALQVTNASQAARVLIYPDPTAPVITGPTDISEYVGDSDILTVSATGNGDLTYQWYDNGTTDGNDGGALIQGADEAAYQPASSISDVGTAYYYCVVTDTSGTETVDNASQSAQVVVIANPTIPVIDVETAGIYENIGGACSLTVMATGNGALTYQWYDNGTTDSNDGGTPIQGADGNAYQPASSKAGTTYYYCVVTNTSGAKHLTSVTDPSIVFIYPDPEKPEITGEPANISEYVGDSDILTVTATGNGDLTYQWYDNGTTDSNDGGALIQGADEAAYQPDSSDSDVGTAYYYCVVTNTSGSETAVNASQAAQVVVIANPEQPIVTGPADITETVNGTDSLTVSATGNGALTYQWFDNGATDSNVGGTPIQGADEAAYQPDSSSVGTAYYYCVVTDTIGAKQESNPSRAAKVAVQDSNNQLASLSATPGGLDKTFDPATTDYSVVLGSSTASTTVSATAASSLATVDIAIDGVHSANGLVALNSGESKTVTVTVTAQNSTIKVYTVHVSRIAYGTLRIYVQDPNGAAFPGIGLTLYKDSAATQKVGNEVVSDAVTGIVEFPNLDPDTYYVQVTSVPSGYHLVVSDQTFGYDVTSGAPTDEYIMLQKSQVYAYNSSQLQDIQVSAGTLVQTATLVQGFDPEVNKYTLTLDQGTGSVVITPKLADSTSKLYINGVRAASKTVKLATTGSSATVTIKVTPKSGKSATYTVKVVRAKSTDADLKPLKVSKGMLTLTDPTTYSLELANTQSSVTFTITTDNKYAKYSLMLDTKHTSSKTVSLKLDQKRQLIITVTAQDGTTAKVYTVNIHRNVSHDANFTFKVSKGTAVQDQTDPTKYTLNLLDTQSSVTVTPKLEDKYATYTMTIDGKKVGKTISFKPGDDKALVITVTAQDGTTVKTCTIEITRPISHDATLANLKVSRGTLDPSPFTPGNDKYNLALTSSQSSVTLTPKVNDVYAKYVITVGGKKSGSTISVAKGAQIIVTITVTAEDGTTTKPYTITINRAS